MKQLHFLTLLAAAFWFILFSPLTKPHLNFWIGMTLFTGTLASFSLILSEKKPSETLHFKTKYIFIGAASAALLYLIFFIGNEVVNSIFDFAKTEIEGIYSTKSQASPVVISGLLIFIIAPAEEIFWRGYIQKNYSDRLGRWKGLFVALFLYSLVHIWSFNLMLVGASFVAGAFWGLMYLRYNSVVPGIISHSVWDLFVFILYPIN